MNERPTDNPSPQEVNALVAHFAGARYAEAASVAQAMTRRFPRYSFGWKALGAILQKLERNADALAPMQQAVALSPEDAEAQNNLGLVLTDLGRLEEAVASCQRALEIKPRFAGALNNLGNARFRQGRLEEAVDCFRRALELQPDDAQVHNNLAGALKDLGRLDEAEASCRRALEIAPHYAEAQSNLGVTLRDLGRLDEAVASYRRALELKPHYAEAHGNLGIVLKDLGRFEEAVASYRRALELKPRYAEAHSNLGNVLVELGQFNEAEASLRAALEINPQYPEAYNNRGNLLCDLGRLDEAVASYRRAVELKPDLVQAHVNLLFVQNYQSDRPAALLLDEARRFGELVARQARPYADWPNVIQSDRRLRVGLVSGDLRNHPVGYFLEGVLAALHTQAADRLEFFAYASSPLSDAVTERIKNNCGGWRTAVGLSDEKLARRIRDDGIDILIDLSGNTGHGRLPMFAWKPAPVQLSWLGYFATTGVASMDYLIADPWTLPEAAEVHFTEKIWRLPETRLCFTPPNVEVEVAPLPALSNGYITFGCFNNLTKMNDAVVALWARVLQTVPQSVLFLKAQQLGEIGVREQVVHRFGAHGVGANRLILEGIAPRAAYLAAYHRVDISLDPFPFPGGTVSAEGLWMGVPVLTLAGDRFLSRQGIGLLMNAGLPDWIAPDADSYVASAAAHAGDLQRLAKLRSRLRQQVLASPIFDAARFARHFEAALRGMWTKWCERQAKI